MKTLLSGSLKATLLRCIFSLSIFCFLSCDASIPDKAFQKYSEAVGLYIEGDNERALKLLKQLHKHYPHFNEASEFYGRVLFYSEKYSEAILCLEKSLQDSMNIDSAKLLARCYLRQNEAGKAESILEKAVKFSSEDPELLYLTARCRIALNDPKEALVLLTAACSLMERQIEIPLELAALYMRYGLQSEAAGLVEQYMNVLEAGHPLKESMKRLKTELQGKKKTRP
jgi:tetratricopeptide (TPR) repeat protein